MLILHQFPSMHHLNNHMQIRNGALLSVLLMKYLRRPTLNLAAKKTGGHTLNASLNNGSWASIWRQHTHLEADEACDIWEFSFRRRSETRECKPSRAGYPGSRQTCGKTRDEPHFSVAIRAAAPAFEPKRSFFPIITFPRAAVAKARLVNASGRTGTRGRRQGGRLGERSGGVGARRWRGSTPGAGGAEAEWL